MAVPTSYTDISFATYIKNEVLQYVADAMDWQIAATPVWTTLNATTGSAPVNSTYITITGVPSEDVFFAGTKIRFTGDTQEYTVTEVAPYSGNYRVRFFPYLKVAVSDGTNGQYNSAYPYETNPAYTSITDEALLALNMDSITDADTEEDIVRLRMVGRIEAWRAVMCNTAAMASNEGQEGNFFNRAQVFFNARDQLILAEQEYGRLFGLTVSVDPQFITTTNTVVKGAW